MTVEQVTPYILALAGIVTAIIGLRKATTEGDSTAVKNAEILFGSFKARITDLETQRAEDRERIKALERAEVEAARQVAESQQRIRELQAANEQSKERLLSLEKDHTRLADMFKRYQRGVGILINQLRELKVEPAWRPDQAEE